MEEQRPRPAGAIVPVRHSRPRRRRRSALLGGAILVAVSPVAVGAGRFVLGYAALGLGASLLLLPPPRRNRPRRRGLPWHVLGRPAAAAGRGMTAVARRGARVAGGTLGAVERIAANQGRDGAGAVGRTTHAAGSGAWSAARTVGPIVWCGLVVASHSIAREARSPSVLVWTRTRPTLRRAWSASIVGVGRARRELAPLTRWGSKRVTAYLDSRVGTDRLGPGPHRAPRSPPATPAEPTRRGARTGSRRSPRGPRSSR